MIHIIQQIEEVEQKRGEICAAGTDLYARRRLGLSSGDIRDISQLDVLKQIEWQPDGSAQIGALVNIDHLAKDKNIQAAYPALAKAAGGLATPQIRAMATVGGNLAQKNRCWYYRNPAFNCYKSGGDSCPARTGNHHYGVAFDLGPCVAVHPSTLGMALTSYEATLQVDGSDQWTLAQFFGDGSHPHVDNLLPADRLITHILLPPPVENEQGGYERAISRFEAEWAMVEACARLVVTDGTIQFARLAIGAVANIPLPLPAVNEYLLGKPATKAVFNEAAKLATAGANPLPMTKYKVRLVYGTVLETLLKTIS